MDVEPESKSLISQPSTLPITPQNHQIKVTTWRIREPNLFITDEVSPQSILIV